MISFNVIKSRKDSKYVSTTGRLAHNPTGELIRYLFKLKINLK